MKNTFVRKFAKILSIIMNPLPVEEDNLSKEKTISLNEETSVQEIIDIEPKEEKDQVLFQPNTVRLKNPIEFPSSRNPSIANELANINTNEKIHRITLECNDSAILHLQSLCRFFEINEFEVISRGIWLMSISRDIEIGEKKIGIIHTDQNGLVTGITPINLV